MGILDFRTTYNDKTLGNYSSCALFMFIYLSSNHRGSFMDNYANESTVMKIGTDVANYILIDILNGGKHYGNSNP